MGYQEVEDLTAYVVLPATSGTLAEEGAGLLVWTTQPWTLVPNVSVVVGPQIEYVLVEAEREGVTRRLVVARDAVARAVGEDARVLRPVPLEELVGTRYQRAFDLIPLTEEEAARGWTVVADEYVATGDGSGLVQTSPAYGAEDLAVGQRYGTPVLHPVGPDGTVTIYNRAGSSHVVVDVNGWYTGPGSSAGGARFVGLTPSRLEDTRQSPSGPISSMAKAPMSCSRSGLRGPSIPRACRDSRIGPSRSSPTACWRMTKPTPAATC